VGPKQRKTYDNVGYAGTAKGGGRHQNAEVENARLLCPQMILTYVSNLGLRYDTIRDAIVTCNQKLTLVSLIYHTETATKSGKNIKE